MSDGGEPGTAGRHIWTALGAYLAFVVLVCGVGAAVSWWQVSDLRDLGGLTRAAAEVTGEDVRRYRPDLVEVRFPTGSGSIDASIPADASIEVGEQVEVAYVAGNAGHVRLVDGWEPAHGTWLRAGVVGLLAGPLVLLGGALTRSARTAGTAGRARRS